MFTLRAQDFYLTPNLRLVEIGLKLKFAAAATEVSGRMDVEYNVMFDKHALLFRLEGSFKDLSTGDQFLSLSGKLLNAWNPMSFPWLTITECAVYLDMFSTVKNATDDWEVKFIRLTNCTAAMNFRGARVDAKASAEFDGLSGHYELMFNASMSGRIAAVIDGMIYGSALNESRPEIMDFWRIST